MSYLFLRYPGFKEKAVSLSYDDCVEADKKMIALLKRYGVKGTFNLNSGLFDSNGRHLTEEEVRALYIPNGMEINVHGEKHVTLFEFQPAMVVNEIFNDRRALEKIAGKPIRGMAYANNARGWEKLTPILKNCGIDYARATECTRQFNLPSNWMHIEPTCSDLTADFLELTQKFLDAKMPEYYWDRTPLWFFVYGHARFTYERHKEDGLEKFCQMVGNRDDIWFATVGEMYRYCQAYDRLEFSTDGTCVYNPSAIDVYLDYYEEKYTIPAGETVQLQIKDFP